VVQGKSGTSTITTAISGGFNSAIVLSATGQPKGVTTSFNPATIPAPGSGTSALTLAAAGTTLPGKYTITVTGAGGSMTQQTKVTLTVKAAPNFSITALPAAITVPRGSAGTSTITTKVFGGFSSPITFTATGQGSAQKVTFSPNPIKAPGSGTSTMTVKVSTVAALGVHTITVTGTSATGRIHTTTVVLTVTQ
jgi:hypothetical protein